MLVEYLYTMLFTLTVNVPGRRQQTDLPIAWKGQLEELKELHPDISNNRTCIHVLLTVKAGMYMLHTSMKAASLNSPLIEIIQYKHSSVSQI